MADRRLFTFGCSFTEYGWPTWADIILYNNNGYNLGISGGGFDSILYRILEADRKFKFTSDDTIIVIMTTPMRWDIILYRPEILGWSQHGQIFNTSYAKYENELFCIDGLVFKSFYNIFLINDYLKNRRLNYIFGSVNNLYENLGNYFESFNLLDKTTELIQFVKNEVPFKLQDFHSFQTKGQSNNWIPGKMFIDGTGDYHPRPQTHYDWVNAVLLNYVDIELHITESHISEMESYIDSIKTFDELPTLRKQMPQFYKHRLPIPIAPVFL